MIKPKPKIKDLVAIVTGASSGIGEETARQFAHAGAKVVLAARREERLKRLAKEIEAEGGIALVVPTDLTQQKQITNLVQATLAAFGRIDILANIAGWGHYDWFEEFTAENLREQYEVNVLGLAELTRQVLPIMKAQRSGHILNMSSYASRISVPPLTVYASTKYAIEGLTDGLRRELLPWGIYVSRIHPSAVYGTEFNQRAGEKGGIKYKSVSIGKVPKERVAHVIVGLVEKPRRAVFLSRLYDVPVELNRLFPGLIDWFFLLWVKQKRRDELKQPPPAQAARYQESSFVISSVLLAFAAIFALKVRKKYRLKNLGKWGGRS